MRVPKGRCHAHLGGIAKKDGCIMLGIAGMPDYIHMVLIVMSVICGGEGLIMSPFQGSIPNLFNTGG